MRSLYVGLTLALVLALALPAFAQTPQAKTQAECYDYLFEAAVRERQLGLDPLKLKGGQ